MNRTTTYLLSAILLLAFSGALSAQTIIRGPYLQKGSGTAMSVRWTTDIVCDSKLAVGTTLGSYTIIVLDTASVTEHELRVTGLSPDVKYYYQTGTTTVPLEGTASNFFVTAPLPTATRKVTFAAFGDCGLNDNNYQTTTLASYQAFLASKGMQAADVLLTLGDNAYRDGHQDEYQANFFDVYSPNILKNHPLFPSPGNHDYDNYPILQVNHQVPYYDNFSLPTAGESGGIASGTECYYSYDWGNVHLLSLDSYGLMDSGATRLYDTMGEQVQWIKNDLANNTKKWVIAYWHHPPYTMGSHNSDNENELVLIRQNLIRILERYGVDIIICGHSHNYERSYLLKGYYGNELSFNKPAHTKDSSSGRYDGSSQSCPYITSSGKNEHGTVYVVAGSSGADGGIQGGYPHNALPFSVNDGGMFYFEVEGNRLDAKFIRRDATVYDQFTIMKDANKRDTFRIAPNSPTVLTASWNGGYTWGNANTSSTQNIVTPVDTIVQVKDSATNTCLMDEYVFRINGTPLPLSYLLLSASNHHQNVQLKWDWESNRSGEQFSVQRSIDGVTFEPLTTLNVDILNKVSTYSYTDETCAAPVAYYRIVLKDVSEKTSHSNVIKVVLNAQDELTFNVYPNPNDGDQLYLSVNREVIADVRITDSKGVGFFAKTMPLDKTQKIPLNLKSGVYFVTLRTNEISQTIRLIVR